MFVLCARLCDCQSNVCFTLLFVCLVWLHACLPACMSNVCMTLCCWFKCSGQLDPTASVQLGMAEAGDRSELQARLLLLLKEHNQRNTLARFQTGLYAQVGNMTAKYGPLRAADVDIATRAFADWQQDGCPGMPVLYQSHTNGQAMACYIVCKNTRLQPGTLHLAKVPRPEAHDHATHIKFMADPTLVTTHVKSNYWVADSPAPPPPAWPP